MKIKKIESGKFPNSLSMHSKSKKACALIDDKLRNQLKSQRLDI